MSDSGELPILKNGWETYLNADNHSQSGFYGAVFINHQVKQLIFTYSGTTCFNLGWDWSKWYNCFQDLYADVEMYFGILPTQLYEAQRFTSTALQELMNDHDITGYNITTTGHSLGAAISNLMAIELRCKGFIVKTINFDSPGSKPVVSTYISANNAHLSLDEMAVVTYNGPTNVINSLNDEVGDIHVIDSMPCKGDTLWGMVMSAVNCHRMDEILKYVIHHPHSIIQEDHHHLIDLFG